MVDRHSGIYQGTGRCRCSHSTGAITADTVQIERSRCTETSADAEHFYLITYRTHEDGIRLFRALGGAYPRRGARPDRRLHPLAQPRSHQTVARLDEPGTIPAEPRNGCVIISKKTSAAPYPDFARAVRNVAIFHLNGLVAG